MLLRTHRFNSALAALTAESVPRLRSYATRLAELWDDATNSCERARARLRDENGYSA